MIAFDVHTFLAASPSSRKYIPMLVPEVPSVVFVDDDYSLTATLKLVIRRFFPHHPVYMCQTQEQALAYIAHTPVACVVTDYYLGRDDGETLAQSIHIQWPDLPIILMTGLASASKVLDRHHYVDVLTKPLSIHTLRDTLQPYLVAVA